MTNILPPLCAIFSSLLDVAKWWSDKMDRSSGFPF